jgi:hypothetical protein
MSVDAVNRGDVPPSMRRKWRNFEARIQRLKRECNTGVRNLDDFWSEQTIKMAGKRAKTGVI